MYKNNQASEVEVKKAEENLQKAIAALVKADPSKPENPDGGTSNTADNKDKINSTPKTGDSASATGIMVAITFSFVLISGVIVLRKKKK